MRLSRPDGFSLLEVLIACGLLTTAIVTLAQLFTLSVRSNLASREATFAVTLAGQKVEELRSLAWSFDTSGAAVSDAALQGGSWAGIDYADRFGQIVGTDAAAGAAFVRRWWIQALPENPDRTISIEVVVTPASRGDSPRREGPRNQGDVRLMSLKTRVGP